LEQSHSNGQDLKRNLKIRHDEQMESQARRHEQELAELRQSQAITAAAVQDKPADNYVTRINSLQQELEVLKNQNEIKKIEYERTKTENQSQAQQLSRQNNSLTLLRQQITMLESLRNQKTEVREVPASCLCQFPLWALAKEQWSNGFVGMKHDGLPKLIQWARL
jgi:hypothetical protein